MNIHKARELYKNVLYITEIPKILFKYDEQMLYNLDLYFYMDYDTIIIMKNRYNFWNAVHYIRLVLGINNKVQDGKLIALEGKME